MASSSRYQVDGGRVATSQGRQLRADPLQQRAHREAMTGWELGSSHHERGSGNCAASSTPWRVGTEYGWIDTTTEQTKSQIGLGIGTGQVPAPEMTLALAPETTTVPKLTVVGVESSPVPSWLTRCIRHTIRGSGLGGLEIVRILCGARHYTPQGRADRVWRAYLSNQVWDLYPGRPSDSCLNR